MAASVISTVMVSNVFTLTTTAGSTDDNGNVMAIMRDARFDEESTSTDVDSKEVRFVDTRWLWRHVTDGRTTEAYIRRYMLVDL